MSGAAARKTPTWSVQAFRAFVETRPEEERWELIDGVAVMMNPPTLAHQRIAGNLERLLNSALETHDPSRMAFQRPGLDLAPEIEGYHPEPDVAVIDATIAAGQRYAKRFYLAAEIVSDSDSEKDRDGDRRRIQAKRDIYRAHGSCACILIIEQDRYRVGLDRRTETGWVSLVLENPDDLVDLREFGLRCRVADLYKGTPVRTSG